MPVYIYKNQEGDTYKEVFQTMKEPHVYFEDGIEWKRVFTVPQASFDTNVDAFSKKQFIEKTANKKGTFGDLLDMSSEMSSTREAKTGTEDPVKRKFFEDYKKENKVKHLLDKPKSIDNKNFKIDF